MPLSGLFSLLAQSGQHPGLVARLRQRDGAAIRAVLMDSAVSFYAAALRSELAAPVLLLTARPGRARRLFDDVQFWCGEDAPAYHLPEGETLPFERLTADDATTHGRIRALAALAGADINAGSKPPVVVASLAALAQRTITRSALLESSHAVSVGQRVDLARLLERWQRLGYRTEQAVETPGTVSRRGGILDVYSPGSELPARIELLGNEVESIRLFDPATQRSVRPVDGVFVLPAQEALPALADRFEVETLYDALDASNCPHAVQERIKEEMSLLLAGHALDEPGFYNGFFCQGEPLDYLPDNGLLVVERPWEIEGELLAMEEKFAELRAAKESRGEIPRRLPSLYAPRSRVEEQLSTVERRLHLYPWTPERGDAGESPPVDLGFTPPGGYMGRLDALASDVRGWLEDGDRVALVSQHAARLSEVLREQGVPVQPDGNPAEGAAGRVALARGSLAEGWNLPVGRRQLRLLSDAEIMGMAKERPLRRRQPAQRAAFLSDLTPGNYLVHTEHGIGRFAGTRRMEGGDREREYLVLEYAEGDKLYVPTDQLDRVSPYTSPGERPPTLTRLGTQEWSRSKARARASTREMARELLALYAAREVTGGIAFSQDTPWQREMEDSFPYTETADQLQSIRDIKEDMESPRADGPAGVRRRGLRQDRGCPARGLQGGHGRPASRCACPHNRAGAPAPHDVFAEARALPREGGSAQPLSHAGGAAARDGEADGGRRGHLHRDSPAAPKGRVFQEPWPGDCGRGTAIRRCAQGAAQGPAKGGRRADAQRNAHTEDAAHGACRRAGHELHRDAAGGAAGNQDLRLGVQRGDRAGGHPAGDGSRRAGLLPPQPRSHHRGDIVESAADCA